jgi:uncharacterized protein YuzE
MKIQYNRDDDALLIHLREGTIDYAEESEGIIVHFTEDHKPVLLEVLDASDWLSRLMKATATAPSGAEVEL